MDDIISSVRTGSPIDWCAEIVGVDAKELAKWRREADAALYKPRRDWTELERRAVEFFARLRQAEADAGMRIHMAGAQLAGLTRERPKRRRTRQRVVSSEGTEVTVDDNGNVQGGRIIEVEIIEEELAPSLGALKMIAAYRFPETMGPGVTEDDWGATAPGQISSEALARALVAAAQRAGVAPGAAGAIDAASELAAAEEEDEDPADDTPTR